MRPLLSILICSVEDRSQELELLLDEFDRQRKPYPVEVKTAVDDKTMSVGKKRQFLLDQATGEWIVYFDDDDWPKAYYVKAIVETIKANPGIDCIGINVLMTTNNQRPEKCLHRLGLPWKTMTTGPWNYHRNITHFNPVLREKALQAGFRDIRHGEDKDYCDRLNPLLKKEAYIALPLFHYRYSDHVPHNEKYGIR